MRSRWGLRVAKIAGIASQESHGGPLEVVGVAIPLC